MRIPTAAIAGLLLLSAPTLPLRAQSDVSGLVARAGAYVEGYMRDLGSLVAEEEYEQHIRGASNAYGARRLKPAQSQADTKLRSDFLLVRMPALGWVPFRDVFERDGKMVRTREDRFAVLFATDTPDTRNQLKKIQEESSRYNIGNVDRDINVPTFALPFVTEGMRDRFTFTAVKDDGDAKVVEFTETAKPTLIKTTKDRDLPLTGRLWIEEKTGAITRTEIHAVDAMVEGHITVTYKPDRAVKLLVPVKMEERYKGVRDPFEVTGTATYSKFRKFSVTTKEEAPR